MEESNPMSEELGSLFGWVVAISTWLTPMVGANQGWIVNYGNQRLVEANAEWHGYELSFYPDRCGFATMSPANLGQIGWFQRSNGSWYGPCLAVDVSAMKDFYANVWVRHEVAEVGPSIRRELNFEYGEIGVVFMGKCPRRGAVVHPYIPPLKWNHDGKAAKAPSMWPYPPQQMPLDCENSRVWTESQSYWSSPPSY